MKGGTRTATLELNFYTFLLRLNLKTEPNRTNQRKTKTQTTKLTQSSLKEAEPQRKLEGREKHP